jgi:hypothetical protein
VSRNRLSLQTAASLLVARRDHAREGAWIPSSDRTLHRSELAATSGRGLLHSAQPGAWRRMVTEANQNVLANSGEVRATEKRGNSPSHFPRGAVISRPRSEGQYYERSAVYPECIRRFGHARGCFSCAGGPQSPASTETLPRPRPCRRSFGVQRRGHEAEPTPGVRSAGAASPWPPFERSAVLSVRNSLVAGGRLRYTSLVDERTLGLTTPSECSFVGRCP